MYQVAFENVWHFFSNQARLKFCDDDNQDHAKGITIPSFFFLEEIDKLQMINEWCSAKSNLKVFIASMHGIQVETALQNFVDTFCD